MLHDLEALRVALAPYPHAYTLLAVAALLLASFAANWLTKRVLLRALRRALAASPFASEDEGMRLSVIPRLANAVPALVLYAGVRAVPELPPLLVEVVRNVCAAFIVLTVALSVSRALDLANLVYLRRPDAHSKPIKGYLQVLKIMLFALAGVLMVATLIDQNPMVLLSGLGAMMAVLILVFQDTLLSLVASVQIASNDMVRVGDWVEMPSQHADGDVVDIALHTVKIQNWDKSISTVPTKKLITESFKNWRGMTEAGGRRIKRAVYLDQHSVVFLDARLQDRLAASPLLGDYLARKGRELAQANAGLEAGVVQARRLTNLGTFRAYVEHYLREHPDIHQDMTLLVRQLEPGRSGIPIELYCFTRSTAWNVYEGVQADIFDHLLAVLPQFGLRVFQDLGDPGALQRMAS